MVNTNISSYSLPSSGLYSHPKILLEEHLINTAAIARSNLELKTLQECSFSPDIFQKVLDITCLLHDIGKATLYFQKKLLEGSGKKSTNALKSQHSLLSASLTYFAVKEEMKRSSFEDDVNFYSFAAYLAVKRHHGNLRDVLDETYISNKKKKMTVEQIQSINKEKFQFLLQQLNSNGLNLSYDLSKWLELIDELPSELRKTKKRFRKSILWEQANESNIDQPINISPGMNITDWQKQGPEIYFFVNLLYSHLLDADKSEVVLKKLLEREEIELTPSLVDNYKQKKGLSQEDKINELRQKAYQESLGYEIKPGLKGEQLKSRIFSINLPTGLGKTLTSLAFAFKLRQEIKNAKGFTPRIIYSLPFLSIIEQNADVFFQIFEENNITVGNNILLKHHHLSDLYYDQDPRKVNEEGSEFEGDSAKILIEGWNSEIVITTFIQLFHSFLGNRNSMLRKFHRFGGSIVILDEVQSVPFKYWKLIREVMGSLALNLNLYLILVTATQPLIFPPASTN